MRAVAAVAAPWPLNEIQGLIISGYRADFARHFALSIADGQAEAARAFVLGLTQPGWLTITTAKQWTTKPNPCLNLAFTYRGLQNLGVPADSLAIFTGDSQHRDSNYVPFGQGTKARAATYLNDPDSNGWAFSDSDFDLLLSIWTDDAAMCDRVTDHIRALTPGTFAELPPERMLDGHAFEDNSVYFGLEDNIAQPIIRGSPVLRLPDGGQDPVDPSAFLIGTGSNIYQAKSFTPERLGRYGCFAGFLQLQQHEEEFHAQVAALAPQMAAYGVDDDEMQKQTVTASMCGRWPNGVSLAVYPVQGDSPPPKFDKATANDFLYVLADGGAADEGSVCPIGSHMRRANMRLRKADPPFPGGAFPGVPSSDHRIMRRAMPYQNPYMENDRHNPSTERGLVGLFLGTSLLKQFEQVFGSWINGSFFTDLETDDALIGANDPVVLTVPGASQPTIGNPPTVTSCVTTKAAAYVFYPCIDAIRFISGE